MSVAYLTVSCSGPVGAGFAHPHGPQNRVVMPRT